MKKKLHEITDEELLKSLEGEDLNVEKLEYKYDNPVLSFVQAFELEPGTEKVPDKLLLFIFKKWYKGSQYNQATFNYQLDNILPFHRHTSRKYYLVTKKAMELAKYADKKAADKVVKYKSKAWIKQFENFLDSNGIKPGTIYVEIDVLYYVYNRWCDDNRRRPLFSYRTFNEMCILYFDINRITDNDTSWIRVNSKIKELITPEEVQRWREGRKRHGKNKKADTPYKRTRKYVLHFKKDKTKKD